jgi:hypothetical protein
MQSPEGGILAHSSAHITIHVVFSTKNRLNLIPQNKVQEMFAYIIGIAGNNAFLYSRLVACRTTFTS